MATWLIPALKAVLPHIGTILSAASPVFTKKKADTAPNQTALLQQQITELQAAAAAEARIHRALMLCLVAAICSAIALCTALLLVVMR